jgi:hypothetical protein
VQLFISAEGVGLRWTPDAGTMGLSQAVGSGVPLAALQQPDAPVRHALILSVAACSRCCNPG